MLNKILVIYLVLITVNDVKAQENVGINTTNPEQKLHVAGSNATIRIEGLSATNNSSNYGVRSAPLQVNDKGDFILTPSPTTCDFLFDITNMISTQKHIKTGLEGQAHTEEIYETSNFTLSQPGNVLLQYSLDFSVWDRSRTTAVSDGKPKIINTFIYIGNGTTPNTSIRYANSSLSYTNSRNPSTQHVIKGPTISSASELIFLPAGTYNVYLFATIAGRLNNGDSLKTSDSFSTDFGNTNNEYLKVVAFY